MKTGTKDEQMERQIETPRVKVYQLEDDGTIPNNPELPLLIYQAAFDLNCLRSPLRIEEVLKQNGWSGTWRNGIYAYHHYHSTAHEVLAVYDGSATVKMGGEHGVLLTIGAGDVLIIPAGVAHKNLESGSNFAVIGAYPVGQEWDMCYGKPGERPRADENIAKVPFPEADPVYGRQGPLLEYWKRDR